MRRALALLGLLALASVGCSETQSPAPVRAVSAPLIGPLVPLDEGAQGARSSSKLQPSIAGDGTGFLVAWCDQPEFGKPTVRGWRTDPQGQPIDATPFTVPDSDCFAPLNRGRAAIAHGSAGYLVAATVEKTPNAIDIGGVLIAPDGVVTDVGLLASTSDTQEQLPTLASDGTGFLLVYRTSSLSLDPGLEVRRISSAGIPQGSPVRLTHVVTNDIRYPNVAFDGTNYLVTFQDADKVFGQRFTADGNAVDGAPRALLSAVAGNLQADLAFADGHYLIAHAADATPNEVRIARLDTGLNVVSMATVATSASATDRTVVAAPSGAMVAWLEGYALAGGVSGGNARIARIAADGSVTDPSGIPVTTTPGAHLAMAASAGGFLSVWHRALNESSEDLSFGAIDASGTVTLHDAAGLIEIGPAAQRAPAVAFTGAEFLSVWSASDGSNDRNVMIRRSDGQGQLVGDSSPLAATSAAEMWPAIARGNDGFLAAWSSFQGDDYFVSVAKLDASGRVLSTAVVAESEAGLEYVSVNFDGENYLVAYDRQAKFGDIYARQVDASGQPMGEEFELPLPFGPMFLWLSVDIAWGGVYLVAFSDQSDHMLYYARFKGDGTMIDQAPVQLGDGGSDVATAYGENLFVVVNPSPDGLDIHRITIESVSFHWSWPLFLIATGLSWALFWMME